MSLVIVSTEMGQKLERTGEPVEICTADGRRIGYFTPAPVRQYDLDPGISDEEIRLRMTDRTGRPLADILRDLDGRA